MDVELLHRRQLRRILAFVLDLTIEHKHAPADERVRDMLERAELSLKRRQEMTRH